MTELRKIPNVGPRTEADLLAMGYTTIESLKGKTAEELYAEECRLRGCQIDRCQLYLYRAASISSTRRIPIRRSASGGSGRIGLRRKQIPSANRPVGPIYAAASGAVCKVRRTDKLIRDDTER